MTACGRRRTELRLFANIEGNLEVEYFFQRIHGSVW